MPATWEQVKRIMRIHGIAEEVLVSARQPSRPSGDALEQQLDSIVEQLHRILLEADLELASEFEELLESCPPTPLEPRAVLVVGWLKGALATELGDARARETAMPRKRTLGFKIRPRPADREQVETSEQ